ncbi:sex hormone-binding globulin isoform X2 [Ornithorhynchus anatinus]|uniref:sex hormone-binding globulin isoform X2 n=1 Tax=Ornithorhynchus anatinus TaxID=9258 RepID=UPI0010A89F7F|nr:sex hormone-binding globulin isoform X2 [Ornithorhynchus anatinus]
MDTRPRRPRPPAPRPALADLPLWSLLLLLLLPPPGAPSDSTPAPSPQSRPANLDSDALHLGSHGRLGPVLNMTFDLTKVTRATSYFDLRTWDPEGVVFYGDTDPNLDWFLLGLREGRAEIQINNPHAQVTVAGGPKLNDGKWHRMEVTNKQDMVLLAIDGDEVLTLRQVSKPLAGAPLPLMKIALGNLLFPPSKLRLPLVPSLDACLRRSIWLDVPLASVSPPPTRRSPLRACEPDPGPGAYFPSGSEAQFALRDLGPPGADPWNFTVELGLRLVGEGGPTRILAFGTPDGDPLLSLHLQNQDRTRGLLRPLSAWRGCWRKARPWTRTEHEA